MVPRIKPNNPAIDFGVIDISCVFPRKSGEPRLLFGKMADEELVHIDSVVRGQSDLVCPGCDQPIIPVKSNCDIRHHFRHKNRHDCKIAGETNLHVLGKMLIEQHGGMQIPEVVATGKHSSSTKTISNSKIVFFEKVELEPSYPGLRPDLVATAADGTKLFIEIFVTHSVDDVKKAKIEGLKVSAVEIDLSRISRTSSSDQIREAVLFTAPRNWLHNTKQAKLSQELCEADEAEEAQEKEKVRNIARNRRNVKNFLRHPDVLRTSSIRSTLDSIELLGLSEALSCLPELNSSFAYEPSVWRAEVVDKWLLGDVRSRLSGSKKRFLSATLGPEARAFCIASEAFSMESRGYAPVGERGSNSLLRETFYQMYPDIPPMKEALHCYSNWMKEKGWLETYFSLDDENVRYRVPVVFTNRNVAILSLKSSLDLLLPILDKRGQCLEIHGELYLSFNSIVSRFSDNWLIELDRVLKFICNQIKKVQSGQEKVSLTDSQKVDVDVCGLAIFDPDASETSQKFLDVLDDILI